MPLNCDDDETWGHGYSIVNYMKTVREGGKEREPEESSRD